MTKTVLSAAVVLLAALGACAERPEVDQIVQQTMIGLPASRILACLGAPARRLAIGATRILIYPGARAVVEGGPFSPGVNGLASGLTGGDRACNVDVVLTNGAVTQVYYTALDDGPLRLGERCVFAVRVCTDPGLVRAAY
ncbi:MAG: hypothetical protein ABSG83_01060 [Roseiarcus sp.]